MVPYSILVGTPCSAWLRRVSRSSIEKASKEEKGASKAPTLVEEGLMGPAFPQGTLPINPVPKEGLLFDVTDLANNFSSFIHVFFPQRYVDSCTLPCQPFCSAFCNLFCEMGVNLPDPGAECHCSILKLCGRPTFWTLSP